MTCRDCIHYEVCKYHGIKVDDTNFKKEFCGCFKDASQVIFLPCKVGDELWYVQNEEIKCSTVDRIYYENIGGEIYSRIDSYGYSVYFRDVGEIVFLTREEAERKLNELNKKI